jgi:group I intron endonuclease
MSKKTQYIYSIKSIKHNLYYIGKTCDPNFRKYNHFRDLKNNNHCNKHLQRVYNKYGKENLVFTILKKLDCCTKKIINQVEIACIKEYDSYHNGYNLTEGGDGGRTYTGNIHPREKKVYQYDMKGVYVKQWKNARLVFKKLGFNWSKISAVCRGSRKSAYNYMWSYRKLKSLDSYKNNKGLKTTHKAILKYDLDGNFIKEYSSIIEAVRELNKKHSLPLVNSLKYKDGIMYGYKFKYK